MLKISSIHSTSSLPPAGSTDMGCSAGISSAVFFAGMLAGAVFAGPVGALFVICYNWKRQQARTRTR